MLGHPTQGWQMSKIFIAVLVCIGAAPLGALAAEPVNLAEDTYKSDLGVIVLQVNWGRIWKCNKFENVQLQAMTFSRSPVDHRESISLELETPSKLFVDNKYLPYALVVQPGEYLLTAFDVKVARSGTDVVHILAGKEKLVREGKSIAGSFKVEPGEIVYVGHFGIECGAEPFLWRYYVDGRQEFVGSVEAFRKRYPFLKDVPVHFRLFSTRTIGEPYSLQDPIVK